MSESEETHGEIIFLLKKLQEQMTFLERKVDALTNQLKERPKTSFSGNSDRSERTERPYSKPPFRPTSSYPPSRHGGRPESERGYGSDKRGYAGKKKPFFSKNKER